MISEINPDNLASMDRTDPRQLRLFDEPLLSLEAIALLQARRADMPESLLLLIDDAVKGHRKPPTDK